MMPIFPAVLIGGPPHSGKSVLIYSLTQALRQAHVPHYALRACPDGEGDWANEADQSTVRTIRVKGSFDQSFTNRVISYLKKRHLPLLVDVGGRPTPAQEEIFAHCTHAVLLVGDRVNDPGAAARDTAVWEAMMAQHQVPVMARITSTLHGQNQLLENQPIIEGTISGLERGQTASGSVMDALVAWLSELFRLDNALITRYHLAQAPVEITLDLPELAQTLGAANGNWLPEHLPDLVSYLPANKPLAGYDRAPNWVYATLAAVAIPAPFWLFDARLGWVQPPILPRQAVGNSQTGWSASIQDADSFTVLTMKTEAQYLDIDSPERLPLGVIPSDKGIVLSGRVPHWLVTAVVRQVANEVPWTAVYQPQLQGAVIVYSLNPDIPIGKVVPYQP